MSALSIRYRVAAGALVIVLFAIAAVDFGATLIAGRALESSAVEALGQGGQDGIGVEERVAHVRNGILAVAAATIVVVCFLSLPFSAGIAGPVRELSDFAERVAAGNLDLRAPESGPKETRQLAVSLNRMLDRLTEAQRHHGEQAMLHREVVETAVDGIMTTDSHGKVLSFNGACETIFGYRAEEVIGQPVSMLIPAHAVRRHERQLDRLAKTGEGWIIGINREVEGQRKTGEVFPLDLNVGRAEADGEFVFVGTLRDGSERRTIEHATVRTAEATALLHKISSDANEAREFGAAVAASLKAVCGFLGWPVGHLQIVLGGEAQALEATDLWHLDDAQTYRPLREAMTGTRTPCGDGLAGRALETGEPVWIAELAAEPDRAWSQAARSCGLRGGLAIPIWAGERIVAVLEFFAGAPIQADPQIQHCLSQVVGQLGRVYERVRYTETLERREQDLARSNRHLEEFAYVASHDLKAPLRGIDNLAQWLQEDLEASLTEETRENFRRLRLRVHRLERLIEDLLRFSRAGRVNAERDLVDVGGLVRSHVESLDLPSGVAVELSPSLPCFTTQRVPLVTVLCNLVDNAVKHRDREDIEIRVECVDKGPSFEFSVDDSGPGIAPEYQERIFGLFQTLKPRKEVEASGMGLAIVKRLVESVEGRVWVESDPSARRTSFKVLWPKGERKGAMREVSE